MDKQTVAHKAMEAFTKETGLEVNLQVKEFAPDNFVCETILTVSFAGQASKAPVSFLAIVKNIDRFHTLYAIQTRKNLQYPLLIIAPYISREVAEKCKTLGISFMDTAGNAYINSHGHYVYVIGKPRPANVLSPGYKAITPTGMRVIFVLLTQHALIRKSYREIACASGVSLGAVGSILADLENRRFIASTGKKERRLIDTRRLIDEWVTHYPVELRSKLNVRRFSSDSLEWWKNASLEAFRAVWGGEVAAAKLTANLKPLIITLYISGKPDELIFKNHLQADINGNIEILEKFWKTENTMEYNNFSNLKIVHPLLIYADLLATADSRDREVAKEIEERYLENIINQE